MPSFPAKEPLRSAVSRLRDLARPNPARPDAVTAYCRSHPGALRLGHVLWHLESEEGIRPADLVLDGDVLFLLDRAGTELMRIPRERVHAAGCAPGTAEGCWTRGLPQSEEHVFIRFSDEDGVDSHLELSIGAMDDAGPVHQMCDCLRSWLGLPAEER